MSSYYRPKKSYPESLPSFSNQGSVPNLNSSTPSLQPPISAINSGTAFSGSSTATYPTDRYDSPAPPAPISPAPPGSMNGVKPSHNSSTTMDAEFKKATDTLKTHFTISPNSHFIDPPIEKLHNESIQQWKKAIVYPVIDTYLAGKQAEIQKLFRTLQDAAAAEIKRLQEQQRKEMDDLKQAHEAEMVKLAQGIITEAQEKMKVRKVTKVVKIEYVDSADPETWKSLDPYKGWSGKVSSRKLVEKVTVE